MASFAEIHKNTIVTSYDSIDSTFKEETQEKYSEQLKTEYRRYLQNKILYDCLVDCIDSAELDTDLGTKLGDIIYNKRLKQYLKWENQGLLGLTLNHKELTYQEGEKLKTILQKKIWEKRNNVFEDFKNITSKDLVQVIKKSQFSASSCDLYLAPITVIEYKKKLEKEQKRFTESVINRNIFMEKILDLRLNKVFKLCNQATRCCKVKIESNYLKAKIAEYKMKLDIFMEVPKSIEAYQDLIKDIKQQQEECDLVIEQMKEMKMKYETVSGREYDEILKSYLMYKHSIDDLKKMYALVK